MSETAQDRQESLAEIVVQLQSHDSWARRWHDAQKHPEGSNRHGRRRAASPRWKRKQARPR